MDNIAGKDAFMVYLTREQYDALLAKNKKLEEINKELVQNLSTEHKTLSRRWVCAPNCDVCALVAKAKELGI